MMRHPRSAVLLGLLGTMSAILHVRPKETPMAGHERKLRCLAVHDERFLESVFSSTAGNLSVSELDPKTHALVRVGALLALGAAPASLQSDVDAALGAGASFEEIVGTLIAVAPTIGSARTVAQVRELALAIGYDVDAGLEEPADQGTVERTRNHEARS
jgi:alkylhydroperoxidase/carboxymuconolactone decarboxylase family protein YurZ